MQLGVVQIIGRLLYPIMHFFFHTSLYGGYAVFMGFFCGYPIGAKVTNDLLEQNLISVSEANRIICFSNNTSPGFLQNYLLISLLDITQKKLFFILLYYIPILTFGIISGLMAKNTEDNSGQNIKDKKSNLILTPKSSFSIKILDTCILEAFKTMLKLCGYLIIFSILSTFIYNILPINVHCKYFLTSISEITTGSYYISQSTYNISIKAIFCIAATAFGGFSTLMQTKSVCTCKDISIKKYLLARIFISSLSIMLFILATNLFHI